MAKHTLNHNGVIRPTAFIHTGNIQIYRRPNRSLVDFIRQYPGKIPRICLTRKQGGIGDLLMITPTIKSISTTHQTQIDFGVNYGYLDGALPKVLYDNPYISRVFPHTDLNLANYDVVIDLTCPCIAHEVPLARPVNRVDLFAQHAATQLINVELDYYMSDCEKEWAQNYLIDHNITHHQVIMVQATSSTQSRDLPNHILLDTITRLLAAHPHLSILYVTHDTDYQRIQHLPNVHILHNLDIRKLAAIMYYCNLVLCPDSSLLHLAAALHKTALSLFGPTDPRARINYHPEAVAYWPIIHNKNYPIWYQPQKDPTLPWKPIDVDVIIRTVLALLNDTPLPNTDHLLTFGDYKFQ